MRLSNKDLGKPRPNATRDETSAKGRSKTVNDTPNMIGNDVPMKLIPWDDIWTSLRVARIRGNGEMIEVFYDTLFKEAVFDDNGAWALDIKNRN
jgi:hypothetical protein